MKSLDTDELLDIVEENNNIVGQATREEVYEKGLLHRAVNIFIFNSKGRVFLQKRGKNTSKFQLCWDISVGEHVKKGETFEQAASRGLEEELRIGVGVELVIPLHKIFAGPQNNNDKKIENELVETYKGVFDGEIIVNSDEIEEGKFFSVEEINKMIEEDKNQFASWFLDDWEFLSR